MIGYDESRVLLGGADFALAAQTWWWGSHRLLQPRRPGSRPDQSGRAPYASSAADVNRAADSPLSVSGGSANSSPASAAPSAAVSANSATASTPRQRRVQQHGKRKLASVSGGATNLASGNFSSVSGGGDNVASGSAASVSGGEGVIATTTEGGRPAATTSRVTGRNRRAWRDAAIRHQPGRAGLAALPAPLGAGPRARRSAGAAGLRRRLAAPSPPSAPARRAHAPTHTAHIRRIPAPSAPGPLQAPEAVDCPHRSRPPPGRTHRHSPELRPRHLPARSEWRVDERIPPRQAAVHPELPRLPRLDPRPPPPRRPRPLAATTPRDHRLLAAPAPGTPRR